MIISISRRTDIPAYYSQWLLNRLEEGFVLVRNPMNYHQVSRVSLKEDVVDCLVFWTKNPAPLMPYMKRLSAYTYYFTFTLNPYGGPVENSLPSVEDRIATFQSLASMIGSERMVWRYDPIILTDAYDEAYHMDQFRFMAEALEGKTDTCVISFMKSYPKIMKRTKDLNLLSLGEDERLNLVGELASIGRRHGIVLESCSSSVNFDPVHVKPGKCIDDRRISRLLGQELAISKDRNQRQNCGCVKSIDIGAYNTCHHDCIYCYANYSKESVINNTRRHDPKSPFMIGNSEPHDKIKERV